MTDIIEPVKKNDNDLLDKLKFSLSSLLKKNYSDFIADVSKIPVSGKAVQHALDYFDTGFLWMHAAIEGFQFPPQQEQDIEVKHQDQPAVITEEQIDAA